MSFHYHVLCDILAECQRPIHCFGLPLSVRAPEAIRATLLKEEDDDNETEDW